MLRKDQVFLLVRIYHWYILADQVVKKLDANNYSTSMTGLKYKLAHKRQRKEDWSARDNDQKERLIEILKEMISQAGE